MKRPSRVAEASFCVTAKRPDLEGTSQWTGNKFILGMRAVGQPMNKVTIKYLQISNLRISSN
jgi:hypothetical protein